MRTVDTGRRRFIKKTGGSLIATTAGSGMILSALEAHAAQSAVPIQFELTKAQNANKRIKPNGAPRLHRAREST